MVSACPTFLLVPLKEYVELVLNTHLSLVAESGEDATFMKRNVLPPYGVGDGRQFHAATLRLMDRLPRKSRSFVLNIMVFHPSGMTKNTDSWQASDISNRNDNKLMCAQCAIIFVVYG